MYYIDYTASSLTIAQADVPPELARNTKRFTVSDATDLDAIGGDLMLRCMRLMGYEAEKLPPEASDAMFRSLGEATLPLLQQGAASVPEADITQLGSLGPLSGEEPPPTKPNKKNNRKPRKKDLPASPF